MVEDWEIGALYWNCMKLANYDETSAVDLVKKKMFELWEKRDLYFFIGTTLQFHALKSDDPFVIIGLFYPPVCYQYSFEFKEGDNKEYE